MSQVQIKDVIVNFPFEPYQLQIAYMTKVIETLESGTNAILESPTGTGKTLSLLCSTLAWILNRKESVMTLMKLPSSANPENKDILMNEMQTRWDIPKVIYTSRTHSQLTQAIQELKRSSYSFVKAVVLGSRDQLCIHPEVSKEPHNSTKIQLCKVHVTNKTCSYHSRVEEKKNRPEITQNSILDIEDLVTIGRKIRMCPYFGSKEIAPDADIIFMPYNYLLDPKARRANKINLKNTIVIFDEAHNVEKICEEAASVRIKSSDIALAIEDVTHVMKILSENSSSYDDGDEPKDFSLEDLASLKEVLLKFETAIDEIEVPNKFTGSTFPGNYMIELFAKANISTGSYGILLSLVDRILTFITTASQRNSAFRKGVGLQLFADLASIVFDSMKEDKQNKAIISFKVHVELEEIKQTNSSHKDGWTTTKAHTSTKYAKVVNYWCFNAGFGMDNIINSQVRSIILTSGTLAPLKPLIAELGIPITNKLENPHIIKTSQLFVKVVSHGPDKEKLISNYENRDNPKYISSLGGTITNFCNVIPDGVLVFFPSYAIMNKCVSSWQASGTYSQICKRKPIFVEPQGKDAFNATMSEFYEKINSKIGACFFAVCRGKVSEGLDFADANGRAVIITGLPFPPLKDPRVILKRQYLESNRTRENELLSGQEWYTLEATRAVNQAIGRVIRHKNDYGAILLCDIRFGNRNQQSQLSSWIQGHLKNVNNFDNNFGRIVRELKVFFDTAKRNNNELPSNSYARSNDQGPSLAMTNSVSIKTERKLENISINAGTSTTSKFNPLDYQKQSSQQSDVDFKSRLFNNSVAAIDFNEHAEENSNLITIHKRDRTTTPTSPEQILQNFPKKKKLRLVTSFGLNDSISSLQSESQSSTESQPLPKLQTNEESSKTMDRLEFLNLIRCSLSPQEVSRFNKALISYRDDDNIENFFKLLCSIFNSPVFEYLLKGTRRYIKNPHKSRFDVLLTKYLELKVLS